MLLVLTLGSLGVGLNMREQFSSYGDVERDSLENDWMAKALDYQKNMGYSEYAKSIETTSSHVKDVQSMELSYLTNNNFDVNCCPSPYSSSTGCACLTPEQSMFLNSRGNNRTGDDSV